MSRGPRWTADEDRLLREYAEAGWSMITAMRQLGRSYYAVKGRSWNMGLHWGRHQPLPPAGSLRAEIDAAKREAPTAPLFRPGDRV
jgi:hypothetical protein